MNYDVDAVSFIRWNVPAGNGAFTAHVLAGNSRATKVKDSPLKDHMPGPLSKRRLLNAHLRNLPISKSPHRTGFAPTRRVKRGNTVCLYLSGGTRSRKLKILFDKLAEGAEVTDPLKDWSSSSELMGP